MSSIMKRRLCLSYRMESSLGDYNALHKTAAPGEHWCMMKCIRHPDCWAFNFFQDDTCELLSGLDCGELRPQPNSTFVHLSTCEGESPVNLSPKNWAEHKCLMWTPHNKDLPCPPDVLRGTDGKYCVSLAPWKGLYMPGWFRTPNGYRFVTESQTTKRCPAGYVVKSAVGCTMVWQNYTVGDPVPPNAVQVSVWRDGTPLYTAEYQRGGAGNYIGYYLPNIRKVYVMAGKVFSPTHVKILVLNWFVCEIQAADALRWRHNGCDSVSNHQPHHCLLNCLFRRRSKKTSKLRVTGLCAGNSPETGEFPAQMASNAEKVSIWWRHHGRHLQW